MGKHWMKACLVGFVSCAIASAETTEAPKAAAMGAVEAGIGYHSQTGTGSGFQYVIDQLVMRKSWEASEKTHVVFENTLSAGSFNPANDTQNGALYVSRYALTGGAAATGWFQLANTAAYLEHKSEGFGFSIGHMRTPFSIENTMMRYNMPTYYYSAGYKQAQDLGWNFDLGAKITLTDILPGNLEVGVFDGRSTGENKTPNLAARYSFAYDGGDFTLTPSVAALLGRWNGGPKDMGFAVGALSRVGTLFVNAEWIYAKREDVVAPITAAKSWDLYVEPGVDLGVAEVSAKWEMVNNSVNSDMNLGVAVGKTYSDKFRVRASYQATNLSKKHAATMGHDFRLLVGTQF